VFVLFIIHFKQVSQTRLVFRVRIPFPLSQPSSKPFLCNFFLLFDIFNGNQNIQNDPRPDLNAETGKRVPVNECRERHQLDVFDSESGWWMPSLDGPSGDVCRDFIVLI